MTQELWILMAVCILLPPAMQLLIYLMSECSANRNGRGIDGIGAALLTGIISKILIYATLIAYLVLLVVWIVKVINAGRVHPLLIAIPFIHLVVIIVIMLKNHYHKSSFSAQKFINEMLDEKEKFYHDTVGGKRAFFASNYIERICYNYLIVSACYGLSDEAVRQLVPQTLPALMEEFLSEDLCEESRENGQKVYVPTTVEHWELDTEHWCVMVRYGNSEEMRAHSISVLN